MAHVAELFEHFGIETGFEHQRADVVVAESRGFDGLLDVLAAVDELVDHLDRGVQDAVASGRTYGGDESSSRRPE